MVADSTRDALRWRRYGGFGGPFYPGWALDPRLARHRGGIGRAFFRTAFLGVFVWFVSKAAYRHERRKEILQEAQHFGPAASRHNSMPIPSPNSLDTRTPTEASMPTGPKYDRANMNKENGGWWWR